MLFGERLKSLRRKKYSQEELAELLHVHNNTISKWENGAQAPRMNKVKELANILGTTVAYLMGETDEPMPLRLHKQEEKVSDKLVVDTHKPQTTEGARPKRRLPGMAFWGSVIDNMRDVLEYGTKEEISDARNMLKRALSLKSELTDSNSTFSHGISAYNGNNSSYNASVMSVNASM